MKINLKNKKTAKKPQNQIIFALDEQITRHKNLTVQLYETKPVRLCGYFKFKFIIYHHVRSVSGPRSNNWRGLSIE